LKVARTIKNRSDLITESQRSEFWKNGHISLPAVANTAEVAVCGPSITELVQRLSTEKHELKDRDTYGKAFLQVTNIWRHDETVKQLVFNRKFAQVAADLLGVEKVRLYHDQALFKEPGGGHTPWHQDKYYWPLDTDKMITMWMPLVEISEEMGAITFASGSHLRGLIDNLEISDQSEEIYDRYITENEFETNGPDSMNAGDATFHLGWTIHGAGPNRSVDKMREVMTIIYFADGARVTTPESEHQQADLVAWLPSRMPGELANTDLNPVMN
jgi:ectoine hydroxylase-related dioxygenase (phytanoyl-CoA dioxygenase family)